MHVHTGKRKPVSRIRHTQGVKPRQRLESLVSHGLAPISGSMGISRLVEVAGPEADPGVSGSPGDGITASIAAVR